MSIVKRFSNHQWDSIEPLLPPADRITSLATEAAPRRCWSGTTRISNLSTLEAPSPCSWRPGGAPSNELTEIHRFAAEWEKQAMVSLRTGDVEVIGTYARHLRIREGTTDQMLDAALRRVVR